MRRSIWLGLLGLSLCACDVSEVAGRTGMEEHTIELAIEEFDDQRSFNPELTTSNYVSNVLGTSPQVALSQSLGLPGYAYFQGAIYSQKGICLAGQVRVVGGVRADGNVGMAQGAMTTTNPAAMAERIQTTRPRWKVDSWVQE